MGSILVFAEQRDGIFRQAACEALGQGRRLADAMGVDLVAGVIGSEVMERAPLSGAWGADRVLVADAPELALFSSDGYVPALAAMARIVDASTVLLAASTTGKALGPALAARLGAGLASDCVRIDIGEDGRLRLERPVYAGKALATVVIRTDPQIVSLRPNVFPSAVVREGFMAPVERVETGARPIRATVRETVASSGGKPDLTEAGIIVSGGRGMGGPEHFAMLEELADVLGGVVGASRAVVDLDWRPHGDQVGQTGKTVSPSLYIACGISGAIQHLAGMSSSRCIVAINRDADAPIFQKADYGIVGDVFEIVPALTEQFRKALGK
jgi:electron transfer flavoprotein alpha subunit